MAADAYVPYQIEFLEQHLVFRVVSDRFCYVCTYTVGGGTATLTNVDPIEDQSDEFLPHFGIWHDSKPEKFFIPEKA